MKKSLLFLLVFGFVMVVGSTQAAQAATACFDWDCSAGSGQCTFDASCSSASPYIWRVEFEWGDGTDTGLTSDLTWDHDYTASGPAYPDVTLTIYFFDEPLSKSVTCDIVARNVVGPAMPVFGRCSAS